MVRRGGSCAGIDGVEHEVGQFVLDPRRLIFLHARHRLVAGIKPQPGVQQVALLDRFDDRSVGRFRNSKAAIPAYVNRAMMRPEAEIFYESARLQQNTVNDGFPVRGDGRKAPADRPIAPACAIRLMAEPEPALHASPGPSFPPCLIPAVDGIFRPGGGRSGTVSKTSGRACPIREKLAAREGTSRRWADGGNLFGR